MFKTHRRFRNPTADVAASLSELGGSMKCSATEKFRQLGEGATGFLDEGRRTVTRGRDAVRNYIVDRPVASLLTSFGIGAIAGALLQRRR